MLETSHPEGASPETSPETSNGTVPDERADIRARWKKGQSGNPAGRKLNGSGCTLTWLSRAMLERPVEGESGRTTRLVAYLSDIVRRADDGDLKCRMFLLREIGRGDRRKQEAERNAKRAKTEELRKFEEEKAAEISSPGPPLAPEVEAAQVVTVSPTVPPRGKPAAPARVQPAAPSADDASTYRRDPMTGRLMAPDGSVLTREDEERLLYPAWPHVSPHLKKEPEAGSPASPARERQVVDFKQDSPDSKFVRENPAQAGWKGTIH